MRSCKEISVLLSASPGAASRAGAEQLGLRLHLLLCDGCSNFRKQLDFMRAAVRRYRDGGDAR